MNNVELTQQELRKLMHYDPLKGEFTWRVSRGGVKAGSVVGHRVSKGYLRCRVGRKNLLLHRLAFLYMEGEVPEQVDHKNLDKSDNSWDNLRACNNSQNMSNRGLSKANTSGYKGVSYHKRMGKWMSSVGHLGNTVFLGYFDDIELAALVSSEARKTLQGDFYYD